MPRPPLTLAGLCLCLLICLALPAAAVAGFAPAADPIVEAEQVSADLGTDASGDSLVVWSQQPVLGAPYEGKARWLAADGTAGPLLNLAPGEIVYRPHLAVSPAGRAFVAWRTYATDSDPYGIKGRWVEPDGSLGPLLTFATGEAGVMDAGETQVAISSSGVATVVWSNQTGGNGLELRRAGPDSALGPLVSDIADGSATNPQVAALPNGSTLAVWRGSGTEISITTPELEVSAPTKISETSLAGDNQLALDAAGNVLVVWRRSSGGEYGVSGRRLAPTGAAVGPELTIAPLAEGFVDPRPEVAADSSGNFIVGWARQDSKGISQISARGVNAAGVFAGPAQPVSPAGIEAGEPLPSLLDAGLAPLVWSHGEPGSAVTFGGVLNRQALPVAPAAQLLGQTGIRVVGSAPAGLAAFMTEYPISGSAQGVAVTRYLVPPTCADSTATVVQGRPVSVPLACTGLGIDAAAVAEAPRNGSVAFDPATLSFSYTPRPGFAGTDSFAYAGANDGGAAPPARVTIAVGKDTVKPRVRTLKLIRKGKAGKQSFKLQLVFSEPASARVTLKQVVRVRGKAKLRKLGTLSRKQLGSKATLALKGRLAKKLNAGGRFRVVAVATDAARNKSVPKKRAFRVR